MNSRFAYVALISAASVLSCAGSVRGVEPVPPAISAQIERLEGEIVGLRGQVETLKRDSNAPHSYRLPSTGAESPNAEARFASESMAVDDFDPGPGDAQWDAAFEAAAKKHAWSLGDFRIVPYGAFWTDMNYATSRTNNEAYTLYVYSRQDQGESSFTIDTRRSRFGLNVTGPMIPLLDYAQSGGKVEIDFQGAFVTENKASVLLRHAYWEAKNDYFRVLVGQTWDVISPLYPGTLNYSVGWEGGNIGYRRAQIRLERYFYPSDQCKVELQASLNQDIVSDFATTAGIRRELSDWPVVEGRLGAALGDVCEDPNPVTFGVSGHIGETGFDFLTAGPPPLSLPPADDTRFRTWSLNADWRAPLTPNMGVQGEFFTGANLSAFLGGIGQGVCPCVRVPIRASGGWIDFWIDWTDCLHSHFGFGVDDPNNADSLVGRIRNQFFFTNITLDVTDKLVTGFEVAFWETSYHELRTGLIPADQLTPSEPGEAVVFQWMIKYGF